MPRCRFLFAADIGDPISSIYLGENGCMAGTMLGKVWLYSFDPREARRVEMLTAFSDEGIRALYLDEDSCCATLTEGCRGWRRVHPHAQLGTICFRSLDKKNTQNVKHVLQRGPLACVIFPTSSTMVHVTKQDHHHCGFKLFDYGSSQDVAPCDFDGESVMVVDRNFNPGIPIFRIIHLEKNESIEVENLPHAANVTIAKLWGPDCLVYIAAGSSAYVYDFRKKVMKYKLSGHTAEIMAVDTQDPEIIATMSSDANVRLWNAHTGDCVQSLSVPEASFFLGYPYLLSMQGQRLMLSCDEGVILWEFDS